MGFTVRRCFRCSAGKSWNARSASRYLTRHRTDRSPSSAGRSPAHLAEPPADTGTTRHGTTHKRYAEGLRPPLPKRPDPPSRCQRSDQPQRTVPRCSVIPARRFLRHGRHSPGNRRDDGVAASLQPAGTGALLSEPLRSIAPHRRSSSLLSFGTDGRRSREGPSPPRGGSLEPGCVAKLAGRARIQRSMDGLGLEPAMKLTAVNLSGDRASSAQKLKIHPLIEVPYSSPRDRAGQRKMHDLFIRERTGLKNKGDLYAPLHGTS